MSTTKNISVFFATLSLTAIIAFLAPASPAYAASGGETFFSIAPETAPAHSDAELNQLFQKGIGPYSSSMKDKLYPYRLPQGGQFSGPLYNGCYDRRGRRLGNLDTNYSCATIIAANPGKAIFRLFLGYKILCGSGETSGTCSSAQLLMNCEYKQVQVGQGTLESTPASTRYCSNESGILRNAQGSSSNDTAANGCAPGEDGSGWTAHPNQPCPKCSPGFYNANYNPNITTCQACPMPTPLPTGVSSIGGWTSPVGATSSAACRPTGVVCSSGYHVTLDTYSCEPDAPTPTPCLLSLNLSPKNPSATASPNPPSTDGQITANVSGNSGTPSISITSPSAMSPSNAGLPAIFNGLSANTYTVRAIDNACTTSAQITLTENAATPSCSSCPSGSVLSGTNCVAPPTTSPSVIQYSYSCQGAGGCTSQPCSPTCTSGMTFGQVSSTDSTPRTCDGNGLYTTFGGTCTYVSGPTTIPASTNCPSGFNLNAGSGFCEMACTPPPPSCSLALGANSSTNPTTSGGTEGTISMAVTGSHPGSITFSRTPASGSISSTATSTMISGLNAGTYTVTAQDSVDSTCVVSKAFTLTDPAPSCNTYTTSASSYPGGITCNYTCTGPPAPVVTKIISSGTCGGKYNGGLNFCDGTKTGYSECANEVWAENQLGCTTSIKPAGSYHTQPPGSLQGSIAGPAEASTCSTISTCGVTGTITAQSNPTTVGGSDGTITISVAGSSIMSPSVRDNGTSITTLSSSPQSYTITGRSAGSHPITLVNQAGMGCTATVGTATLTDPAGGCNVATTTAGSGSYAYGIRCTYDCVGAGGPLPDVDYGITSGTCSNPSAISAASSKGACTISTTPLNCSAMGTVHCGSATCPGGKTLRVFHYSQELSAYATGYCIGSTPPCTTTSTNQGSLCWTNTKLNSYYMLCSTGNDPGNAILNGQTMKQCSNDAEVPGSGYWNDRGQACTY